MAPSPVKVKWLVGRSTSPFSTKIGHIRDKVLGGDSIPSDTDTKIQ